MRIKHVLWRVGNGWIRTPDDHPYLSGEKNNIFVFDNLRQFSDWAKREEELERKRGAVEAITRLASSVPTARNDSTLSPKP